MKHFLLIIHGDVEPELLGPMSQTQRDSAARRQRCSDADLSDGLYPLDIDEQGNPTVGAFANADLMPD